MPNKKKKYNARFPPARIKKIMQTDEEIGKVAAAVPVIISRALELFAESLILKTSKITALKNAKTLSSAHLKQCIAGESQFDFLKDVVANVPDIQGDDDSSNPATGETTPLPQTKLSLKPLKRQRRKFSKNNGDDGAGPSRVSSESENDLDEEEEEEEEDDDDEETVKIENCMCSEKSRNVFQDISNPAHRMHVLPNGATSVIMKPQSSAYSVSALTTTASIQGMDEDYDS